MSDKKPAGSRRGAGRGRSRPPQPTAPPGPLEETAEADVQQGRGRGKVRARGALTSQLPSEERTERSPPSDLGKALKREEVTFVERPDFGATGRKISLETNHFSVTLVKQQLKVYQYQVDIKHSRIPRLNRDDTRLVFWSVVNRPDSSNYFPNRYTLAYDGAQTLFSRDKLRFPNDAFTKTIQIATARENPPGADVTISIMLQDLIDVDFRGVFTNGERNMKPLQFLDIVSRQSRSLFGTGLDERGGPWYSFGPTTYVIPAGIEERHSLGGGCYVWFGVFSGAHVAQLYRPLLNLDVAHGVFYRHGDHPVVLFLVDVLNEGVRDPRYLYSVEQLTPQTQLRPDDLKKFTRAIKGVQIRRQPAPGLNVVRQYRVQGVGKAAIDETFNDGNATVSVANYFQTRYGALRYPKLPVLRVGSKKRPTFYPIEVCYLAHPQRRSQKLSDNQLSTLIRTTAVPAPERRAKIYSMMRQVDFGGDPWLNAFGVSIAPEMKKVVGRVLPPASVEYNPTNCRNPNGAVVVPQRGEWSLAGQKVFQAGAPLVDYGVIYPRGIDRPALGSFFKNLCHQADEMGVRIAPQPAEISDCDYAGDMETKITEMLRKLKPNGNNMKFIFVVMASMSGGFYAETKRAGDVATGVMTQCLLQKTVQAVERDPTKGRQTLQNIILKVNAKMGGVNNRLYADGLWARLIVPRECTLFIGADVSLPPGFDKETPSVAARDGQPNLYKFKLKNLLALSSGFQIVSNVDLAATRYSASITIQKRPERRMNLANSIRAQLMDFFTKTNNTQPSRIVYYREGAAESQFEEVLSIELGAIREACANLSEGYRPKVTFITATKRHHTRFFCLDRNDGIGRSGNIPPGTMVDQEITSARIFDFYLCSHVGIQGTSRPARYSVLYDDSHFTPDEVQTFTYSLSNVYCRCARSVSIPAPLYYAHWACLRAKYHLHEKIRDFSSDTMSVEGDGTRVTITEDELMQNATIHPRLKGEMYFV